MSVAPAIQSKSRAAEPARDYVTATIAGQLFGIPVLTVQDVLGPQRAFLNSLWIVYGIWRSGRE